MAVVLDAGGTARSAQERLGISVEEGELWFRSAAKWWRPFERKVGIVFLFASHPSGRRGAEDGRAWQ